LSLACDCIQEWLGTNTLEPNVELGVVTSLTQHGAGRGRIPGPSWDYVRIHVMTQCGVELGTKIDIASFWIVISCDGLANGVGL